MYMLASGCGKGAVASLGGVGHLPHDDVAAFRLGQHGLHLAHLSRSFLRFIVLSVSWRVGSSEGSCLPPNGPPRRCPLTDAEVDVAFASAQHKRILQLLALGVSGRHRGPGALGRAVQHAAVEGGQHVACQEQRALRTAASVRAAAVPTGLSRQDLGSPHLAQRQRTSQRRGARGSRAGPAPWSSRG